jgi:hypothetical protein
MGKLALKLLTAQLNTKTMRPRMMLTAEAEARPYLGRYPAPLSIVIICLRTYVSTDPCEGQYI